MPLEQLLSLYGYATQSPGPSSSSRARTGMNSTSNLSQFESSTRPRRKRARGSDVVLLGNTGEPSTEAASSSCPPRSSNISSLPDCSTSTVATASNEVVSVSSEADFVSCYGGSEVGSESVHQLKVHPEGSSSVSILSWDASGSPGEKVSSEEESDIKSGEEVKQVFEHGAVTLKHEEGVFSGQEVKQDVSVWSEMEQDDTTDVEVVEDDGVELEVGLGLKDEGLLQLAQMEREGLHVVRMDDIEAGLSKGERSFSPLKLTRKKDFIGVCAARMCVEGLGVGECREEEGKETDVLEQKEEEGSGVEQGALYEDVMLSSGSNSQLLSDSSGKWVH